MVEMRWVSRDVPAPEYGAGVSRGVMVLQYRTNRQEFSPTGICWSYDKWKWDEWRDVPTVEAD